MEAQPSIDMQGRATWGIQIRRFQHEWGQSWCPVRSRARETELGHCWEEESRGRPSRLRGQELPGEGRIDLSPSRVKEGGNNLFSVLY